MRRQGVVAVLVGTLALLCAASIHAEVLVGTSGTGAGQVLQPRGVAVDEESGLLYVVDSGNSRIDVFDADTQAFVKAFGWGVSDGRLEFQTCTTSCLPGLAGDGAGQFNNPTGVAVDNDSSSPSFHAVYVTDSGNARVQKFSSGGAFQWMVGGGVNKTTGDNFCAAGSGDSCGAGSSGTDEEEFSLSETGEIGGLAVAPGGILSVADQVGEPPSRKGRIQRYSDTGTYMAPPLFLEVEGGAGRTIGFAIATGGDFYVATSDSTGAVRHYSSTGTCLNCANPINPSFNITAIAVDDAGNLFLAENNLTSSGVFRTVRQFDSAGSQLRAFYGLLKSPVRGMAPYTHEDGRLFASEEGRVLYMDFPPPGPVAPPDSKGVFADQVRSSSATFHSLVNPEGDPTTFHYQYVDQASFEAEGWAGAAVKTSSESNSIGSDFNLHEAVQKVTGLAAETEYRFRVVATSSAGVATGVEGTFETTPPVEFGEVWSTEVDGESATLYTEVNPMGFPSTGYFEYVDDAAYQVSGFTTAQKTPSGAPLDLGSKEEVGLASSEATDLDPNTLYHYRLRAENNCKTDPSIVCSFGGPEATFHTFADPPTACAPDGGGFPVLLLSDCRGYEMVSPVDKNGSDIDVVFTIVGYPANLDQGAADGQSITYSAYRAFADPAAAPYSSQFLSTRTAKGWETESISPPRKGPTYYNSAGLDYQFKAFTEDLCSGWFLQDVPEPSLAPGEIDGYPNLYRRDNCGPEAGSYEAITTGSPTGSPKDFLPVVQGFSSDGSKVFFWVKDKLTGNALSSQPQAYEAEGEQLGLVCVRPDAVSTGCAAGAGPSDDRNGKVFQTVSGDGSRVYWSDATSKSLYLREGGQSILVASGPVQFRGAASDGSKVFYLAGSSQNELFEYDLETETSNPIAGGVQGVAGMSDDAAVVYFASSEVLAPGAIAGKPNLYRSEEGSEELVTTLGPDGVALVSPIADSSVRRLSRVTPDGNRIVFVSQESLTGYDNTDTASGKADAEVFLYDATANGGAGELRCISCNPTEARPTGQILKVQDFPNFWVASWIPVGINQLTVSRMISDDGSRVFFNSFDRLVAWDNNEAADVYEWEAPGAGDCTESISIYVEAAGGCVNLISSGEGERDSTLVDSSATGDDVFFKTASSLVHQDKNLLDIYDARVNGGFEPPLPPEPECEGEECPGPVTPMPVDPTPASTLPGPGNPPPPPATKPKKCPQGKHKVKRGGKVVCVKNKKKAKGKKGTSRRAAR
jgi:hypothetical protein